MSDAFGIAGAGQDLASLILTTLQTILLGANTLAGEQVEISRVDVFTDADVVAIALFVPRIEREWLGGEPIAFRATVHAVIAGIVYATEMAQAQDQADILRVQIEQAVLPNAVFRALPIEKIRQIDTEIIHRADSSPRQVLVKMSMQLECTDEFAVSPSAPLLNALGVTVPADVPEANLIGSYSTL